MSNEGNLDHPKLDLPTSVLTGSAAELQVGKLPKQSVSSTADKTLPPVEITGLADSKTKAGVEVEKDDQGQPKAFHSGDFSIERHDDGKWWYHQNSGGKFVELKDFKMNEDGTVTAHETGLFNREHTLTGDGQKTESVYAMNQRKVWDNADFILNPATAGLSRAVDAALGTHTSETTTAFTKGVGETLIDGTVNGLKYLVGLGQGGLEEVGILPHMKHFDQWIPDLHLVPGLDPNASQAEKLAHGAGEVTGFVCSLFVGAGEVKAVSAAPRIASSAINAIKEGRVISSLSDGVSSFMSKGKGFFSKGGDKPTFVKSTRVTDSGNGARPLVIDSEGNIIDGAPLMIGKADEVSGVANAVNKADEVPEAESYGRHAAQPFSLAKPGTVEYKEDLVNGFGRVREDGFSHEGVFSGNEAWRGQSGSRPSVFKTGDQGIYFAGTGRHAADPVPVGAVESSLTPVGEPEIVVNRGEGNLDRYVLRDGGEIDFDSLDGFTQLYRRLVPGDKDYYWAKEKLEKASQDSVRR